jgi:hypothetical protein
MDVARANSGDIDRLEWMRNMHQFAKSATGIGCRDNAKQDAQTSRHKESSPRCLVTVKRGQFACRTRTVQRLPGGGFAEDAVIMAGILLMDTFRALSKRGAALLDNARAFI